MIPFQMIKIRNGIIDSVVLIFMIKINSVSLIFLIKISRKLAQIKSANPVGNIHNAAIEKFAQSGLQKAILRIMRKVYF